MAESVRADRWLWATRFYKTRTRATEACQQGRIRRGGRPLKPAAPISAGDRLEIPAHDRTHTRQVEVVRLDALRGSAPVAQSAYLNHTSAAVLEEAARQRAQSKDERQFRHDNDQGRMTKKLLRAWQKAQPSRW